MIIKKPIKTALDTRPKVGYTGAVSRTQAVLQGLPEKTNKVKKLNEMRG